MLNVREKNYSHTSSRLTHQNFFPSQLLGLYEDGNWSPGNAYIYVTLIYNLRSCNLTLMYITAGLITYLISHSSTAQCFLAYMNELNWTILLLQHLGGPLRPLPLLLCHEGPSPTVRPGVEVLHRQERHLPLLLAGGWVGGFILLCSRDDGNIDDQCRGLLAGVTK